MTSIGITPDFEEKAQAFYTAVIKVLAAEKLPFMMAGTYAVKHYTGLNRPTKDLDFFCTAGDYPKILKHLEKAGYRVTIEDARWLARAYQQDFFVDIIFGSIPGIWPITQKWLERAETGTWFGHQVLIAPPEELIVSKIFRMKRAEFDGSDIVHLILKQGDRINWVHLLESMDTYWEIFLIHLLLFRFVYPSEREKIPRFVMDNLQERLELQLSLPVPKDKVSRGSIISWEDYRVGVEDWGFKDVTEYTFSEKRT